MSNRRKVKRPSKANNKGSFHIEFKNAAQSLAWSAFKQHDVLFLTGPAGCGKTFLACAFAIEQVLNNEKERIVLTRPIVEAGESLGYLPGELKEKVDPYMTPMWDCIKKLVGKEGPMYDKVINAIDVRPLAYMRGITFSDSVCIFDEAQNATKAQLKLFLTRFDDTSKVIITGDPRQSDIDDSAMEDVMERLQNLEGVGKIGFKNNHIVRHPLIGKIIDAFEKN